MTEQEKRDMRDLAGCVAECIRRMGAEFGAPQEWRDSITRCVKIEERISKELAGARS